MAARFSTEEALLQILDDQDEEYEDEPNNDVFFDGSDEEFGLVEEEVDYDEQLTNEDESNDEDECNHEESDGDDDTDTSNEEDSDTEEVQTQNKKKQKIK